MSADESTVALGAEAESFFVDVIEGEPKVHLHLIPISLYPTGSHRADQPCQRLCQIVER